MSNLSLRIHIEGETPGSCERQGFALLTVILLTLAMAALAASAVFLTGNAGILSTSQDREREFKYGAEAAMAIGKSRLNTDPLVLPDTSYVTLMSNQQVFGADGAPLPGVTVNLYAGPTGSTSGQFGRFASVVAEARDGQGARFVRRLELTQESFAKYAYWSNHETNNGQTIYFANGDNLWGPVWSNDNISIASSGAWFHNEVGTAKAISGKPYGTFSRGYSENQQPIKLPSTSTLSKLTSYAASGNTNFVTPNSGAAAGVIARVEFVAVDLGGPTDSTGVDEGFLKVYVANVGEDNWLRGDWTNNKSTTTNCGAAYRTVPNGPRLFFPASVHNVNNVWFTNLLIAGGMTARQAQDTANASLGEIMAKSTARCYLGGDPHLVAIERNNANFTNAEKQIGGDETTFTPVNGARGHWLQWTGPVDARLAARRPWDAQYLFPIYRGLNPGTKGVAAFSGTIGVSGVLRGRMTIYSTGSVIVLDDLRYATDPSAGKCADMLGIIAANDITVADNAILGPQSIQAANGAAFWKNFDDTKDVYVHGIMMALNTSFGAENYSSGPSNANGCEGGTSGRGCLYLYGGLIQESRGAVGLVSGQGYVKRYSYDHCAIQTPPPYFPTTGRFVDNRYYEIDPVRFNVAQLFASLVPGP
jgi:hypothetical protein